MVQHHIEERSNRMTDEERNPACCPLFGVESGVPIIGLGILLILFGIVPLLFLPAGTLPLPISAVFTGFGIFLIWAGLKK